MSHLIRPNQALSTAYLKNIRCTTDSEGSSTSSLSSNGGPATTDRAKGKNTMIDKTKVQDIAVLVIYKYRQHCKVSHGMNYRQ